MSQKGKIENGAELLARLGPRPSLRGLTAWAVLGLEPTPGDILELYGGEGVGKTELLLHLVSSTLLSPSCGRCCHGEKPEVIWVDCDLKFSVLRLAVLLEQQLMEERRASHCKQCCPVSSHSRGNVAPGDCVVGSGTQNAKRCVLVDGGKVESSECGLLNLKDAERAEGDGCCEPVGNRGRCAQSCLHTTTAESTDRPGMKQDGIGFSGKKEGEKMASVSASFGAEENIQSEPHSGVKTDSNKQGSFLLEHDSTQGMTRGKSQRCSLTRKRKAEDMESGEHIASQHSDTDSEVCDSYHSKATSYNKSAPSVDTAAVQSLEKGGTQCPEKAEGSKVSGEEVEAKVEECLQRVQVLRCLSSPQLVCTLHSLLPLIAANRNIALLVIDPASAFFWSDRCGEFQRASSFLQKNMTQVASLLKEIATTYGVSVVTSKQALVRSRSKEKADGFLSPSKGLPGEDNHVEFLGQAWGKVVTHRLVCSRCVRGGKTTHYTLSGNAGQRSFTVGESGVQIQV